jgi:hypothetical protein
LGAYTQLQCEAGPAACATRCLTVAGDCRRQPQQTETAWAAMGGDCTGRYGAVEAVQCPGPALR